MNKPRIAELSAADNSRLAEQRAWLLRAQHGSEWSTADRIRLLQNELNTRNVRRGETWKLHGLDVILGDIISDELGVPWVAVDDEFGRDPAILIDHASQTVLFPLNILSECVERDAKVDVQALLQTVLTNTRRKLAK